MQRLLIVGADHLIGTNLALVAQRSYEVVTCTLAGDTALDGCEDWGRAAITPDGLRQLVEQSAATWIVYCPSTANSNWDPAPDLALLAKERARAECLCQIAQQRARYLTVLSSDAVFSTPGMFHTERSAPNTKNPRVDTARAIERVARQRHALVIRTHAYGWSSDGNSFAERLYMALMDNRPWPLDAARYATPILASDLAALLVLARAHDLRGLYHLGGAERCNPLRFGGEMAAALGCSRSVFQGRFTTNDESNPLLSQETSLDSRSASRQLRIPLPMLREGLARFVAQAGNGVRDGLRGFKQPTASPAAA